MSRNRGQKYLLDLLDLKSWKTNDRRSGTFFRYVDIFVFLDIYKHRGGFYGSFFCKIYEFG